MWKRIVSLSLSLAVTLTLLFFVVPQPSARAAAAIPAGCHYRNSTWFVYTNVQSETEGESEGCAPIYAEAYEFSKDCNDSSYTINVDLWLAHATVPGATRYGETGRTGWYTYVGDCNWHEAPSSATARVDDPDWACAWAQVYGGASQDYMCVNNNTAPSLSSASQPSSDLPRLRGKVGDTLIAPNDLQLTLLTTKQDGNLLLFHFHAYNGGKQAVSLIGSGADNQFYYVQSKKFTRTPGLTTAQRAKYGALPSTLAAGASADGWTAIVTTSKTQHAFDTVLYRFGAVPSMTCINPDDRATCHPDEAFQALIWNF